MNKNILKLISVFLCVLLFAACKDDYEDHYQGYGMVNMLGESSYQIKMDDGYTLHPKEAPFPSSELSDSMRLNLEYSILEVQDSSVDVKILRAMEILTKPVIAYDTTLLDSIGNDPIKISDSGYWIAHGFLNFEFVYAGGYPVVSVKHMINLLQHTDHNDGLLFEFRHNAFKDRREQLYSGVVSFPISSLLDDLPKPVKIKVKYHDTNTSDRTIEFNYQ